MQAIPQFASSTLTEVSHFLYALSYVIYLQYCTDSVSTRYCQCIEFASSTLTETLSLLVIATCLATCVYLAAS